MVSPKFVRVTVQTPTTEIIAITCLFILFFKHVALTRQRKGEKNIYSDYDSGGHEMHLFSPSLSHLVLIHKISNRSVALHCVYNVNALVHRSIHDLVNCTRYTSFHVFV